MKILRHLPNALTCGNLLCGCFGILFATRYQLEAAAYCVWLACLLDFFDGFAARLLKVSSPIGKELDSLADMVSFGVLPAMVMYSLLGSAVLNPQVAYLAFLIAIFSALRLAKFNVDEKQKDSFIGVPTPANALFITSLVWLPAPLSQWLSNSTFLLTVTFVFSFLLVSPFELIALKFKNFSWKSNQIRFLFMGCCAILLVLFKQSSVSFCILFYIVVSLLASLVSGRNKTA
jgi:CDP-diacylglycerol---serine O-phosphatidyltransferase